MTAPQIEIVTESSASDGLASRGGSHASRVLWVSHAYGYGQDLMYFGEIFRAFRDIFCHTEVVVDKRQQRIEPFSNPYGIALRPILRQLRIPIRRRSLDGQIYQTEVAAPSPGLIFRLAAARVDVVITIEFTLPALMAIVASRVLSRKALVLLIESDPTGRGGSQSGLVRRIKSFAARRANIIQTNNEKGRRYVVEELGADPRKVRVAPYLTSRPPGPSPVIEPIEGPLRILFANSITQRKGLRQFFEAIDRLDLEHKARLALTIVGDGDERAELEKRAATLGMGDRIRFVGRKGYGELGAFYASSDVLAIPSLADYRSLAGFEGLGYGLALLSSKFDGATDETVEDGINGFVMDPYDPEGIAELLVNLLDDRDRVLDMRRASLALYEHRYSIERIAMNLAESVHLAQRSNLPQCSGKDQAGLKFGPKEEHLIEQKSEEIK